MDWTEIIVEVDTKDIDTAGNIAQMTVPYGIYIEDYSMLEQEVLEIARIDLIDEELLQQDRTKGKVHIYISPEENPEENPDENPEDDDSDTPENDETPPPEDPESQSGNAPWFLIPLFLLALLVATAIWIKKRLDASDPMALCRGTRRVQQAAMIAYRANLTVLAHMGQSPQNGETPDAFVRRVCKDFDNPDYADFVRAISYSRYSGHPIKKENVEVGLRAYRRFVNGLRFIERLRFTLTRIARGLGDFESIP